MCVGPTQRGAVLPDRRPAGPAVLHGGHRDWRRHGQERPRCRLQHTICRRFTYNIATSTCIYLQITATV